MRCKKKYLLQYVKDETTLYLLSILFQLRSQRYKIVQACAIKLSCSNANTHYTLRRNLPTILLSLKSLEMKDHLSFNSRYLDPSRQECRAYS